MTATEPSYLKAHRLLPILSNIVSLRLDRKLTGLAKRFSARYTRYADDITFSSYQDIANNTEFQQELARIISGQELPNSIHSKT